MEYMEMKAQEQIEAGIAMKDHEDLLNEARDHVHNWDTEGLPELEDFVNDNPGLLEDHVALVIERVSEPKDIEIEALKTDMMKTVIPLLKETRDNHRDKDSPDYNECDKPNEQCMWCALAEEIITKYAVS